MPLLTSCSDRSQTRLQCLIRLGFERPDVHLDDHYCNQRLDLHENVLEKIVEKMGKGLIGSVYFSIAKGLLNSSNGVGKQSDDFSSTVLLPTKFGKYRRSGSDLDG